MRLLVPFHRGNVARECGALGLVAPANIEARLLVRRRDGFGQTHGIDVHLANVAVRFERGDRAAQHALEPTPRAADILTPRDAAEARNVSRTGILKNCEDDGAIRR